MCSQGARGHSAEGLRQFLSCFLHFQQLRNGDFRIANRKRGFYFAKIRRSTVFDLLGQFPYNGGHLILHPVHIGLRVIAVGEEIQRIPDKVHIVDIPVTEDLIFTEGSVLLCGAEQKIGFAVKEAVRSSARGCGFICILSSVDRRVDSFDDEAHPFVLYDGFAVIVIGGRGSFSPELGRQVDGFVPVFPPIFIDSFFLRFPTLRHSIAGHFHAGFACGGRSAADPLNKGTIKQIRVKLACRKNCWHRHDPILLSESLK